MSETDRATAGATAGAPRSLRGPRIAAAILLLLSINGIAQAARWALGWDDNPTILGLEQTASGISALVAATGAWQRRRWSAWWSALYGAVTGAMIASLGQVLGLSLDERSGLWPGAAIVIAVGFGIAWYLARALRTPPLPDSSRAPRQR